MSRHRNVRAMNIDEEYEGYYDSAYGHSVEEEFCISPRTEAQFLYNRDTQKHSMSAFLDASPDSHMDEYGGSEDGPRVRCDSMNERPDLSSIDRAKLQSCVEAMQNVVGETISESILIKAATENHFDVEKALDAVLSGSGAYEKPKPPRSQNTTRTKKEFCIHRKYASSVNIGGASKNNHYKCNIKPNGCLDHPSIYDPLILDLLKMFIAFIEFFPTLEKQYSCELSSGNGFSSHLSSFYSLLVPEFCSTNLFTHRYRKIWKRLHLLNTGFKNELGTQELVCNGHVVNKKITTKAFHCISKLLRFFVKLLHIHSGGKKTSLFSNEEQSHLTQILEIFQFHLPLTIWHRSASIPSSNGLQWHCKNHSITNVTVPVKCMPAMQECGSLADDEKSNSSIKTYLSSVPCHRFVVNNCLQYKMFCVLHRNQHTFITGLSLPETGCTNKMIHHIVCKKGSICVCGNSQLETFSCLLLLLLKSNILGSATDMNTLHTAMQRLQFSTGKCDNVCNCKYRLQHFYKLMKDFKNQHHGVKFFNFTRNYFSMYENERICISYVLLPDSAFLGVDSGFKLRIFHPSCIPTKQLLVRNHSVSFSKEVMDVLSEDPIFVLQQCFETKDSCSLQYEDTTSSYRNGKFAFCKFGGLTEKTVKCVKWRDGVESGYSKSTESAFHNRTNSADASSKVLFECAESLHHVRGYCNSLHLFLSSNENPLLGVHLRFRNDVYSGALYFITCCKNNDISESPNKGILQLNKWSELSLSLDHSHVCYQPVKFSSFMKSDVSYAPQNCSSGCTSDAIHVFLDHLASNGRAFSGITKKVNMCTEVMLVPAIYVKTNFMSCLNRTLLSENDSGKGPGYRSISLSSSHECDRNKIFYNYLDLRCPVLCECDNTHDVTLIEPNFSNCEKLLPLYLVDDHICYIGYHVGSDVQCTEPGMATENVVPSVRNFNEIHSKLSLPDFEHSSFDFPMGDHVKFEDTIITAFTDSTIGSCTSLNADMSTLSVFQNLSSETSENCSDAESCDDLSLDDLFSSLNSGSKENFLSVTENYPIISVDSEYTDTGQDCGVRNKLLHTKTDYTAEVVNDFSLSDLYFSMESSEVDGASTVSFEGEAQEFPLSDIPFLADSSSAEKFTSVTTVHTPPNILHSDSDFNTECVLINDQCEGSENVHLKIQSSVLSESWNVRHSQESIELGAYCCTASDNFNCDSDVQRKLTTEDKQQQSDNLISGQNCNLASEVVINQLHHAGSEQQSVQYSSLSELGFDDQDDIFNEKNMLNCMQCSDVRNDECEHTGHLCDEQNDLLSKSLSNIYLNFRETKNSDILCTSSELPSLSPVDSHNNTERSDVPTKCSLIVQNEVSVILPLNGCDNSESQNSNETNLEIHDKSHCSLSDLFNREKSCDVLRNSDFPALQNKTTDWCCNDIFHSPQNCASNVSENLSCDLSFLNCFNNNDNELSQVLNCDTEQASFPNISLSDLYLGNRCISPSSNSTNTNTSHLSCTPLSSVCGERTEISENLWENKNYNSPVFYANLGLTADSAVCETAEQGEPIENITLSDLHFEKQTEVEYPSKCINGGESLKGSCLNCCSTVKSKNETQDCNKNHVEVPNVSLPELYLNVKPIGKESHCTYANSGGLSLPSVSNLCLNLERNVASGSAEKNTEASSSLLDLYINSESDKYFDTDCGGASGEELAEDHHNNEFTVIGNMAEFGSDYFRMKVTPSDICGQDHEIDEVDSKNSISEDGNLKKVSEFFVDDNYCSHVTTKGNGTPVHTTFSPEFFCQTLQPVGPSMKQISEPVDQDHVDIPYIDLSVAQKHPNSCSADFYESDISLTNKLSSTSSSCIKSKLPIFSGSQEIEMGVKSKKSLFARVLKCKSKPAKSCTFSRPPQTLPEILQSTGYTKYFQFSTPSPDDIVKIEQKDAAVCPGSSSTIKPPNLETVEDEKEFAFNREISGRMIISNGDIKTPDDFESVKNTSAAPEGETDCEKAVEKSDVLHEEKGKNDEQNSTSPAEQLSNLKINANDKEVLESYKKERGGSKPLINLVVIGHVDAGKSTLMGHLLYRLGCVAKKMMHKYEQDSKKLGKSSFMYAWVLDETSEERNRGITMDVAQSKFETPHRSVTLLDAPGHKDFIPNMITGAAQADVAVLVLDSTRGEFETGFEAGGQTREHTMLIRSLGVSQLAVAVNKLDNVNWDQDRYKEIVSKLSAFLKQAGFKESEVQFVPCSGLTGENLIKPPETPELKKWYSGPCLVDVIDSFKPPERPVSKPFRFCISDVFKGMGSGFCVSGRIEAGYVQNGDKVLVMPATEQATVKGITIDETTVQHSFAGDHVTLQLSGVDMNNVTTGCVVCDIARPVKVSARFQARLVIFNITVPITKGFPVILHYQSMSEQAFVKKLLSQLHRSTGQVVKKKPRCLTKNTSAVVEIEVIRPICLEVYKDFKELGRFMLRSGGSTIAAGLVTEIL